MSSSPAFQLSMKVSAVAPMASVDGELPVPRDMVLRALSSVLASAIFANSRRLSSFLGFTVEETLKGMGGGLKEYTIGTMVYGRKADFDPSHDTIVRSEARRLRRKLQEYYESYGKNDEVIIFFRLGTYIPVFRWRTSLTTQVQADPVAEPELRENESELRVALMAFRAASEDAIGTAFAFGVSEEILHRLVLIPGLRIVAEAQAGGAYERGGELRGETAARMAAGMSRVQLLLRGSVRSEAGSLRVHARLESAEGYVLWSQRFDASAEHQAHFDLQESVASAFLSRICLRESFVSRPAVVSARSRYLLYADILAAEALLEEGSVRSIESALLRFEELLGVAAEEARVHCGVAQCCVSLSQRGVRPDGYLVTRATESARRAIELDPELGEGYAAMGCALAQEWKWELAEESFRRALCIGSLPLLHRQYATVLMILSRFQESWEQAQMGQGLDPFANKQKLCMARFFFYSGRGEEGKKHFQETAHFGALQVETIFYRALSAVQMGEMASAIEMAERIVEQATTIPAYMAGAAELLASAGREDVAKELCEANRLLDLRTPISHYRRATLALSLGRVKAAVGSLQLAFQAGEAELPWIGVDPRFQSIRGHEDFEAICKGIFGGQLRA